MSYKEDKSRIDKIRSVDEWIFRMAISHLMDVGIRHLDADSIEYTCEEIMREDDSNHFMTNEFKCDLVRTAGELAKIDHIHLLVYISENITYYVGER